MFGVLKTWLTKQSVTGLSVMVRGLYSNRSKASPTCVKPLGGVRGDHCNMVTAVS